MAVVSPNQPIHPTLDERISVKVEGQLPDFVKQDHTTFVAFLEAYYEYMEQEGKPYEIVGNLNNYANLDKTTDDFLQYFKKQFGEDVPEAIFANANKPFVLKHLRDFYRSKGSQKSFEFLFRLLYKEEIDFYLVIDDDTSHYQVRPFAVYTRMSNLDDINLVFNGVNYENQTAYREMGKSGCCAGVGK